MASVRKRKWEHNGAEKEAWVVSYTDQGGKRRLKTFEKKKDADRHRTKVEAEIERGDHQPSSTSATVAEVCEAFLKQSDQRLRDGVIGRYRHQQLKVVVRGKIARNLGAKLFSEIGLGDMERWYVAVSEGKAPSSRRTYLEAFRCVEEFAVKRGYAKRRPVGDFKLERGGARVPIETFSVQQVGQLLAALEVRPKGYTHRQQMLLKMIVNLAVFCGLRRGEIFGLTLPSLFLESGFIRIRNSMTTFNELKGPKTRAGNRDVPVPVHVAQLLEEWIRTYYTENDKSLIFLSRSGEPAMLSGGLHVGWRRLLVRAGLHDGHGGRALHFHALRHFAASWYMGQGMSPPDVATLLGHSTFDVTLQVYAHPIYDDSHRRAAVNQSAGRLLAITSLSA